MTQELYGVLFVIGFIDLLLVIPALGRASSTQETGRLLSTLCVLAGIVGLAGVRFLTPPPTSATATAFLVLVDAGFIGYAIFLPRNGVLELYRRLRARR